MSATLRAAALASTCLLAACASRGAAGPGVWVSASPEAQAGQLAGTTWAMRLEFRVEARPVPIGDAWGLALRVTAKNPVDGLFEIAGHPPLRLTGHQTTRAGEEISFDDGCGGTRPDPIVLRGGDRVRWKRSYGHGTDEALRSGERVTLDLAVCHVKTPAGDSVRSMPVAQVVMVAGPTGDPLVTISEPQPPKP
ncbi:MAG: hypothetical protein H6746_05130 [Deltaproteobacteria bacterium]|nr:hypothetical protein [Deltaproteobacteria bacterium]